MCARLADTAVWRVLAVLAVSTSSSAGEMCLSVECMKENQILRLKDFFGSVAPVSKVPPIALTDVGNYVLRGMNNYLEAYSSGLSLGRDQDKREGRQYYGTTGYNNYYGNTGYGVYGGGSSSTSYNGLDAALSALAFLAFGVWLFNLVLPKIQGSALGLPGLGRTSLPFNERNHSDSYTSAGLLSNIYTNSQDLVNKIFKKRSIWSSRELITKWFGRNLLNTATKTLDSALNSFGKLLGQSSADFTSRASFSSRRLRRWIGSEGQGFLDRVVSYLSRMLSMPPTEERSVLRSQETTDT